MGLIHGPIYGTWAKLQRAKRQNPKPKEQINLKAYILAKSVPNNKF